MAATAVVGVMLAALCSHFATEQPSCTTKKHKKTSALSTGLPGNESPLHQLANQSLSAHPLRWISVKSWGCPGVSVPAGVSYACSSSTVASCPGVRPITGGRIQNTRDGARACAIIFCSPLGPAYEARRRWEMYLDPSTPSLRRSKPFHQISKGWARTGMKRWWR